MGLGVRVCAAHDEGLTDREERRERGLELGLTVGVTLVTRGIGFVRRAGFGGRPVEVGGGEHAVAFEREQSHRARGAGVGPAERRHRTVEDVGQDLAPLCRTRRAADEHDVVDLFAGEGLHVRKQPRKVVRHAFHHCSYEVGPLGLQRHVHESAPNRPARNRREGSVQPGKEHRAARARLRRVERGIESRERVGDPVVAQRIVRVHHVFEDMLEHLAAQAILRAHDVAVHEGAGHREDLMFEVGAEVGHRVDEHAGRADRKPGPARGERAGRDADGRGVVGRRVHDHRRGEAERGRDPGLE